MEIERKFLIQTLPDLSKYTYHKISQAYLNTDPVVRIRKQDEEYYLTYKGKGLMAREEYNLPLNEKSYEHLAQKADGHVISKTRYLIPLENNLVKNNLVENNLVAELDIFDAPFEWLQMVEVEFESIEQAESFVAPEWFGEDVTNDFHYHNSYLSQLK
jgi:CYTH domain-containing protein